MATADDGIPTDEAQFIEGEGTRNWSGRKKESGLGFAPVVSLKRRVSLKSLPFPPGGNSTMRLPTGGEFRHLLARLILKCEIIYNRK